MKFITLVFFIFFTSSVFADDFKIGYIDVDKVINNLPQYKKDNENLVKEFEPKKIELIKLYEHIELLKTQYRNLVSSSNLESHEKDLIKIQNLEIDFQKESGIWQQEINIKQQLLLENIELKINNAIKQFAINKKYDLILYQNAAFVDDRINITNAILKIIE